MWARSSLGQPKGVRLLCGYQALCTWKDIYYLWSWEHVGFSDTRTKGLQVRIKSSMLPDAQVVLTNNYGANIFAAIGSYFYSQDQRHAAALKCVWCNCIQQSEWMIKVCWILERICSASNNCIGTMCCYRHDATLKYVHSEQYISFKGFIRCTKTGRILNYFMAGSNIATNCIMNNRMTGKNRKLEYLKFAKYGNDMWSFYLSIMLHYVSAKTVYFDH